ncbi:MAG: hypothetical protein QF685_09785, partial [Verrucomicrobiota bacterium]|nr:hypothetical protein [Verrucomicrobiota bacterium]
MKYVPWILCVILAVVCAVLIAAGILFVAGFAAEKKEMEQAMIAVDNRAASAGANARKLQSEKEYALSESSTKDGEIAHLKAQLKQLQS